MMVTVTVIPSGRARAFHYPVCQSLYEIAPGRDAPRSADNVHLISVPPRDPQSRSPTGSGLAETERQRT